MKCNFKVMLSVGVRMPYCAEPGAATGDRRRQLQAQRVRQQRWSAELDADRARRKNGRALMSPLFYSGDQDANERGQTPGSMMGGGMQGMMTMMRSMQHMDANRDGLLSKQEFVQAHEAMFDAMPKKKDGVVR